MHAHTRAHTCTHTRARVPIPDTKQFEVIIDNLLNLELLFWSAQNGAATEATLKTMALSHALKTAKYWVRADGSTPHLCIFSPTTGDLLSPCTGTHGEAWMDWMRLRLRMRMRCNDFFLFFFFGGVKFENTKLLCLPISILTGDLLA